GELERGGIPTKTDPFGQVHARVSAGAAKRALVFAAHTDHPAFEVIEASGKAGKARVLGGFRQRVFPPDVAVTVHGDAGGVPVAASWFGPATSTTRSATRRSATSVSRASDSRSAASRHSAHYSSAARARRRLSSGSAGPRRASRSRISTITTRPRTVGSRRRS